MRTREADRFPTDATDQTVGYRRSNFISGRARPSWQVSILGKVYVWPIIRGDRVGRIRTFRAVVASQGFLLNASPIHLSTHIREVVPIHLEGES